MLSPTARELAKREIDASLIYCTNIMNCFGLSFEKAKDNITFIKQTVIFTLFVILAITHFTSEFIYIVVTAMNSPRIEDVVPLLHTVVYTIISFSRLSVIWYKKYVFGRLLRELVDIWPVPPLTDEAQLTKRRSLFLLRLAHRWYFALSVICDIFFNFTPIGIYFYEVWQGHENPKVGFVWVCWYPFDKYRLIPHILVYLFEMFLGLTSLLAMLSADLLFTAIASYICLLLRILHQRLRAIGSEMQSQDVVYKEVIECVKLHQRLITYCNEMEETFSVVNLINVLLSSVAICCVVFVVVNEDVAIAAYESRWYSADPQCRRALLLLIIRAQKPIGFTAMKFAALNLTTYSAILMRSYSYFTLLYTMFKK